MGILVLHMICGGHDFEDRRHELMRVMVDKKTDIEARDANDRTPGDNEVPMTSAVIVRYRRGSKLTCPVSV